MKNEKTQLTREELDKACNIIFANNTDDNLLKVDAVEALRVLILIQDAISVFMGIYAINDTISDDESYAVYMLSKTIKNLYRTLIETKQLAANIHEVQGSNTKYCGRASVASEGSSSNDEAQSE
ncbi:MAG: hypothetical protein IJZ31_10135 [Bacteroidaceae bacterium]|nr:hypothetical protein [Bacteroidaceae bacterium]